MFKTELKTRFKIIYLITFFVVGFSIVGDYTWNWNWILALIFVNLIGVVVISGLIDKFWISVISLLFLLIIPFTYNQYLTHKTYVIMDQSDLMLMNQYKDSTFVLGDDIYLDPSEDTQINEFRGTLDGNGHSIRGIEAPLFEELLSATVMNLRLDTTRDYHGYGVLSELASDCTFQEIYLELRQTGSLVATSEKSDFYRIAIRIDDTSTDNRLGVGLAYEMIVGTHQHIEDVTIWGNVHSTNRFSGLSDILYVETNEEDTALEINGLVINLDLSSNHYTALFNEVYQDNIGVSNVQVSNSFIRLNKKEGTMNYQGIANHYNQPISELHFEFENVILALDGETEFVDSNLDMYSREKISAGVTENVKDINFVNYSDIQYSFSNDDITEYRFIPEDYYTNETLMTQNKEIRNLIYTPGTNKASLVIKLEIKTIFIEIS